jgi:hypothetical protein
VDGNGTAALALARVLGSATVVARLATAEAFAVVLALAAVLGVLGRTATLALARVLAGAAVVAGLARAVVQNAFFGFAGRKKVNSLTIPWSTYTDPEIAHVGLYEHEAGKRGLEIDTFTVPMSGVDRAIADGDTEGFVKIHVRKGSDEILGATVVARHAGEMISEITTAMAGKIGLGKLAAVIHPYPTQTEAIRKAGDLYNRTRLTEFRSRLLGRYFSWRRH